MSCADFAEVRRLALALPGVEEGLSYGTPAFRLGKKLLARLHDDNETLVIKIGEEDVDALLAADPSVFFLTDHYRGYGAVLVRLPVIEAEALASVLGRAWRRSASKRQLALGPAIGA